MSLAPPPPPSPLPGGKGLLPREGKNKPTKPATGPSSEVLVVQVALQAVQEQYSTLAKAMASIQEALAVSQQANRVQGEALASLTGEVQTLRAALSREVDARIALSLSVDALRSEICLRRQSSPPRAAPPSPPVRRGTPVSVSPIRTLTARMQHRVPPAPPTCSDVSTLDGLVLLVEGKLQGYLGMRLEETAWDSSISTYRVNASKLKRLGRLVKALGVEGIQQHALVRAHYTCASGKVKLASLADHIDCSGSAPIILPPKQ